MKGCTLYYNNCKYPRFGIKRTNVTKGKVFKARVGQLTISFTTKCANRFIFHNFMKIVTTVPEAECYVIMKVALWF